jgi:hydrogenase maturation factor HypF (carbamoyltransferase family)
MLKTKTNKFKLCTHCSKEFAQSKSNQKFCSTSCRANSWKMNKTKTIVAKADTRTIPRELPSLDIEDLAKVGGLSLLSNVLVEGIKTFKGVNNTDIIQKLDTVLSNQITIAKNQQLILNELQKSA